MRQFGIEGSKPKELVVGRRYHVAGWKSGANFVLSSLICDDTIAVLYTPKTGKQYRVQADKLRNTFRHKDD